MCHEKLDMHFNRRINFINGANGSGKSAILAALQICLGASAKSARPRGIDARRGPGFATAIETTPPA